MGFSIVEMRPNGLAAMRFISLACMICISGCQVDPDESAGADAASVSVDSLKQSCPGLVFVPTNAMQGVPTWTYDEKTRTVGTRIDYVGGANTRIHYSMKLDSGRFVAGFSGLTRLSGQKRVIRTSSVRCAQGESVAQSSNSSQGAASGEGDQAGGRSRNIRCNVSGILGNDYPTLTARFVDASTGFNSVRVWTRDGRPLNIHEDRIVKGDHDQVRFHYQFSWTNALRQRQTKSIYISPRVNSQEIYVTSQNALVDTSICQDTP